MSSVIISGNTSGSVTLDAPAVAGSTTYTLVNVSGTLAPLVSGTAIATTSGTSHNFTGIPSWVKRITVMFSGVSTNGASQPIIQLGDAGGVEITGYNSTSSQLSTVVATSNYTTGFGYYSAAAVNIVSGSMTLNLLDPTTNTWVADGTVRYGSVSMTISGDKSLSATLDRIRLTTVNGTDAFDAGSINIMYE